MAKLKVYRTSIGFHDAYVAAASQKAALEAWGADANLFARGVAEQVEDPALMAEPLANPGVVIKKLRGTLDEQLAALPKDEAAPKRGKASKAAATSRSKPVPRPSRAKLDAAEAELKAIRDRQRQREQALVQKEAELAAERRALAERHRKEVERSSARVESAREAFEAAMAEWRG